MGLKSGSRDAGLDDSEADDADADDRTRSDASAEREPARTEEAEQSAESTTQTEPETESRTEAGAEAERKTKTEAETDEQRRTTDSIPYKLRREKVNDGRDQVPYFLRDEVMEREGELQDALEEMLGEDVYKSDYREASMVVAQRHPELVAEVLREWGYDLDL